MTLDRAIKEAPAAYKEGWREGYELGSTTCPYEMGSPEQVAYCFGAWYGFVAGEIAERHD